jgi:hypothetical protein
MTMTRQQTQPVDNEPPFEAFLRDLECLNVQKTKGQGLEYGVLRARGNERWWLAPLASRAAAAASLGMFQPINTSARFAKHAVVSLMRLGLTSVWTRNRITFSGLPELPCDFEEDIHFCAYFTGTAGPHRKTAIQFMGNSGNILGYGKISRVSPVRKYIENEAHMLSVVRGLGLQSASTPQCLAISETDTASLLVTDSHKKAGHTSPTTFTTQHRTFLEELAAKTKMPSIGDALRQAKTRTEAISSHLAEDWQARLQRGLSYLETRADQHCVALAHGDFTPWNCFSETEKLYVFDWEYAQETYPLGYDLVHFHLSLIGQNWPGIIPENLIVDLTILFYPDDKTAAREAILFSMILHSIFYLTRVYEVGQAEKNWPDASNYANLIDSTLGGLTC